MQARPPRMAGLRSSATYASIALGRHLFRVRAVAGTGRRSRSSRYAWQRVETKPFSVVPNFSGLDTLYPGAAPIALPLRIANPNLVPMVVTALKSPSPVTPPGATAAATWSWPSPTFRARSRSGYSRRNGLGSVSGGPRADDPPAQSARKPGRCQNVSFPLSFSGRRTVPARLRIRVASCVVTAALVALAADQALAFFKTTSAGLVSASVSSLSKPEFKSVSSGSGGSVTLNWGRCPRRRGSAVLLDPRRGSGRRNMSNAEPNEEKWL